MPKPIRLTVTPLDVRDCPSWSALSASDPFFVVAPAAGQEPLVTVYDAVTGQERFNFLAYADDFTGGVRVAVGDINGDGVPDIITAPGPGGGPHIRAFSGVDGTPILNFFAFEPSFRGGANVAVGDVYGDGANELVIGAGDGGGPRVRVLDPQTLTVTADFFAYEPSFRGGVYVGVGNFGGAVGRGIVTGSGPGGGPVVKVFNPVTQTPSAAFYAYDPDARGGVLVATGDLDGDDLADLVTGPGTGPPEVKVFDPNSVKLKLDFLAGGPTDANGVRVAVVPAVGESPAYLLTGSGPGDPAAIRLFTNLDGDTGQTQTAGDPTNRVGYFVAG
jgi:hypothetical protein